MGHSPTDTITPVRQGRIPIAVLAFAAALIAAPSAQASITVGSSLSPPIDSGIGGDITAFPIAPAGGQTISPVVGTVVGGNVKQNPTITAGWGTVSLRVIHPIAGGQYQVLTAGPPNAVPSGPSAIGTFPISAHLSIAKGDIVAIQATGQLSRAITTGATYMWRITSTFPPGGPATTMSPGLADSELLYNAQIDPTNTFTVGAPTGGKKGKATVVVTVPNPGTVVAGAANDPALAVTAKKKKPKPFLSQVSATAADSGSVILTLTASKAGRKLLREKGKLKATAKIVYTPTGGSASSQTIKLKLKK
jgi:hypothetical protein